MTLHITTTLLNRHSKLQCPFCVQTKFVLQKLPLHKFVSSRALITHIKKSHSISGKNNDEVGKIPYGEFKKIRRLARSFENKDHESFLKWLNDLGYLN